jgi:hypothetical protein
MIVFVAMQNDRHTDPDAEVFTTAEAAIAYARQQAAEGGRGHGYDEQPIPGWLFYANYSPEGDSVWVVEKELRGG